MGSRLLKLLPKVEAIARQAGDAIMDIYKTDDFDVELKDDAGFVSPITKADKLANDVILRGLDKIADFPVISEENSHRKDSSTFWLVDPIDGTKEFVDRNGNFTVNIALIENGEPVLGVVDAPALGIAYTGVKEGEARKISGGKPRVIKAHFAGKKLVITTSRAHGNTQAEEFFKKLGNHEQIVIGSSLKICLVAEGKAMLYPRFASTHLWDTAAADAVLRSAGGKLTDLGSKPLVYDPTGGTKNPLFMAATDNSIDWAALL